MLAEEIKGTKLLSKAGKEYDTTLAFNPKDERPYNGKTYYGNVEPCWLELIIRLWDKLEITF